MNKKELKKVIITAFRGFFFLFIMLGLCFFLSAGTIKYWEAWFYIITFSISMVLFMLYLIKNDPHALKRRVEFGEERKQQKLIIKLSNLLFLGIFIVPGLDFRFNWSSVPLWLVIIADMIFLCGYYLFYLVIKENSYASRTVKVDQNAQKVITTGPYRKMRHPMYTALVIMFGITPLILGSYWGLLVDLAFFIILPLRIKDEEKMLVAELQGYKEYVETTRYRVIPGIW